MNRLAVLARVIPTAVAHDKTAPFAWTPFIRRPCGGRRGKQGTNLLDVGVPQYPHVPAPKKHPTLRTCARHTLPPTLYPSTSPGTDCKYRRPLVAVVHHVFFCWERGGSRRDHHRRRWPERTRGPGFRGPAFCWGNLVVM